MAKVFFTREITPEKVEKMYELAGKELTGKVAVKLHSGEKGNQNFLGPDFWRPVLRRLVELLLSAIPHMTVQEIPLQSTDS